MKKLIVRHVEKQQYANYLKRSLECLTSAKEALESKKFDASAICAIHSCISAVDSMCVYYKEERSAGSRHEEAAELLMSIQGVDAAVLSKIKNKFLRIIRAKNMAEYEERPVKPKEAEKLVSDAEAVFESAKSALPKQ